VLQSEGSGSRGRCRCRAKRVTNSEHATSDKCQLVLSTNTYHCGEVVSEIVMWKAYIEFTEQRLKGPTIDQQMQALKSFNLCDGKILLMLCEDDQRYHEFAIKMRQFLVILEDLVRFCSDFQVTPLQRTRVKRKRS
jgi:hypothetical protein